MRGVIRGGVRRRRLAVTILILLGQALGGMREANGNQELSATPGITIELESDGLPHSQHSARDRDGSPRVTRQTIHAAPGRLFLRDHDTSVFFLFRLDREPAGFWEISPNRAEYRDASPLGKTQADRDRFERQAIENLRRGSREEMKEVLRHNHWREDGRRVVTVERQPHPEKLLGYSVERVRVLENNRVIVDTLVTRDLPVAIPFFDFYRRVGAFSEEVLHELKKVKGIPLEVTFTVVTASLNYKIHAKVIEVTQEALGAGLFDLPPGAVEIKKRPFEICEALGCENRVEVTSPGDKYVVGTKIYYFCSKACKTKWREDFLGIRPGAKPSVDEKR